MKHIKKALSYTVAGSIGLTVIASLNGCDQQAGSPRTSGTMDAQVGDQVDQNLFIVIEQTGSSPDTYKVVEKHPTAGPTRAILRMQNGEERFLSEEELKRIAEAEAKKVEEGTSRLTQDPSMSSGGLSLGETLLAAAAGSLIGGMLANSLMRNRNFQQNQNRYGGGRPTAAASQPYKKSTTKPRSGFFGGNKSGTSSSRTGFGSFFGG